MIGKRVIPMPTKTKLDAKSQPKKEKDNQNDNWMLLIYFPREIITIILIYDMYEFISNASVSTAVSTSLSASLSTSTQIKNHIALLSNSTSSVFFFDHGDLLIASRKAGGAGTCLAWGQPDDAEEILETRTQALLSTVIVKAPNGDLIKGTPYQIVLYINDNFIKNKKDETAVEMVKRLLIANHGIDEEIKQYALQFPKNEKQDWEDEEKKKKAALFAAFDKVTNAFDESKAVTEEALANDAKLQEAITNFKTEIAPKGIITSGRCCMSDLWDYAQKYYTDAKFTAYGGYGPKNYLFHDKVLGSIDPRLQSWGAQVLKRGIYYVMKDGVDVPRVDVSSYYDVSPCSNLQLDDNCWLDDRLLDLGPEPQQRVRALHRIGRGGSFALIFQTYQQANINSRRAVHNQSKQSKCLVM